MIQLNRKLANVAFGCTIFIFDVNIIDSQGKTKLEFKETHISIDTGRNFTV